MSVPSPDSLRSALADHPLEVVGRLVSASNAVFFARVGTLPVVYKPVRGERPLWDFPTGNLASRERAAHLLDEAGGFGIVPPTLLADGPAGPGSVQVWVTDPAELVPDEGEDDGGVVNEDEEAEAEDPDPWFVVAPVDELPDGWMPVFTGELPDGSEVVVAHADVPELRSVAVFDAVVNNTDRKGSHLLRGVDGGLWGIDHGVSLHEHPKLRTVLWGWAGEPIPAADLEKVAAVRESLARPEPRTELETLLTPAEIAALTRRVDHLLATGVHPLPREDWPSVPWPAL